VRPVDVGSDAAELLRVAGAGRVLAVFGRALYLQVPAGLVALTTTDAPRGPLHVRVGALPAARPGQRVHVDATGLRIADRRYPLDAPTWCPRLPSAAALASACEAARHWLPDQGPPLDLRATEPAELPAVALEALRRGALADLAAALGGRGPGLTPAGDDVLAGVLLVAVAARSAAPATLLRCVRRTATNDVARAFLACAARGRCIEPAHDLLAGLARTDRSAVTSALAGLHRFGSSSGAALAYGIRMALLELPRAPARASAGRPAPTAGLDNATVQPRIVNESVG
jgi:hypothetical protein